jgi:hypothetical protein
MNNCPKCKHRHAFDKAELAVLALEAEEKIKENKQKELNEQNIKEQEKLA